MSNLSNIAPRCHERLRTEFRIYPPRVPRRYLGNFAPKSLPGGHQIYGSNRPTGPQVHLQHSVCPWGACNIATPCHTVPFWQGP